jgi:hypothetical protein
MVLGPHYNFFYKEGDQGSVSVLDASQWDELKYHRSEKSVTDCHTIGSNLGRGNDMFCSQTLGFQSR